MVLPSGEDTYIQTGTLWLNFVENICTALAVPVDAFSLWELVKFWLLDVRKTRSPSCCVLSCRSAYQYLVAPNCQEVILQHCLSWKGSFLGSNKWSQILSSNMSGWLCVEFVYIANGSHMLQCTYAAWLQLQVKTWKSGKTCHSKLNWVRATVDKLSFCHMLSMPIVHVKVLVTLF
jgi:hypothetical protein